jgi:hypothetical protein
MMTIMTNGRQMTRMKACQAAAALDHATHVAAADTTEGAAATAATDGRGALAADVLYCDVLFNQCLWLVAIRRWPQMGEMRWRLTVVCCDVLFISACGWLL